METLWCGVGLAFAVLSPTVVAHDAPSSVANADNAVPSASMSYLCDDGKKLTAVIDASDPDQYKTLISVDGDPNLQGIEMLDVMSANGNKTSNGKLSWWTKGDEGFLAEEDPPAGNGEVVLGGCKEIAAPSGL